MKNCNDKKTDFLIYIIFLTIITIAGSVFRIINIDYHSLWFDEGYTIMGSVNDIIPWKKFLDGSTALNAYPPLEFILHHFIIKFFGISDITARLVPCIFGILAIPFIGILGKRIANSFVGICAALLIAFSPLNVYLSSETRYYSHIIFGSIIYAYSVTVFLESQNKIRTVFLFLSILYVFNISILFLFCVPFVVMAVAIYNKFGKVFWKLSVIHLISFVIVILLYYSYGLTNFILRSANSDSAIKTSQLNILKASFRLLRLEIYYHDVCINNYQYIILGFLILFLLLLFNIKKDTWLKILNSCMIAAIPCVFIYGSIKGNEYSNRISIKYLSFVSPFILLSIAYSIFCISDFIAKSIKCLNNFYINLVFKYVLSIVVCLIVIVLCFKGPINILFGNYVKSDWKRVEKSVLSEYKNKEAIVGSCVELSGTPDPCQYIYFDLIPKQDNLNIKTTFFREQQTDKLVLFFKYAYDYWYNDKKDVFLISQKNFEPKINKELFDNDFGKHGAPAIRIRKLKSFDFITKNYNVVLKSSDDFVKLICGDLLITKKEKENLLINPNFDNNLDSWSYWQYAKSNPDLIKALSESQSVIINNPESKLCGLYQNINLISGLVYKIEASVRYPGSHLSNSFFGARLALNIPGNGEEQIIWNKLSGDFIDKSLIITNIYTGKATLMIHMGYGKNNYSGEFKSIKIYAE